MFCFIFSCIDEWFSLTFKFVLEYSLLTNNAVIVSGEQWRDSTIHIHILVSILPQYPWTARSSNQSILKEISPEYSLEGLMLNSYTLITWCKEPTNWKRPLCWERLRAGGEGSNRGWDGWMASPTQRTWVWATSGR